MKFLAGILTLLVCVQSFGAAVIFDGARVKAFRQSLNLNDNVYVLSGSVDPSAVATSAPKGSIYLSTNGSTYVKGDAGLSTSWTAFGAAGSGLTNLNGATGGTQTFANDTNITMTTAGNTHTLGWASTLSLSRGGTGKSITGILGGIVYGSTITAFDIIAAGTSGQILTSAGAAAPTWGTPTGLITLNGQGGATQITANDTNIAITSSNNTHTLGWLGTLSLARGGSGNAITGLAGGIIYNSTVTAMNVIAAGTSGQILTSGGAGAPTWGSAITLFNLQAGATQVFANDTNVIITSSNNTHTLGWASTLSLSRGGTGKNITGIAGGIIYNSTITAMDVIAAGTSGQVLLSGGAGAPTWGTGGSGITTFNLQTGATQVFANDTNIAITSSNNTHTLGWVSTLSLARGGTGKNITGLAGGIVYGSTATAFDILAAGTAGQVLGSNGAGAPTWTTRVSSNAVQTVTVRANISYTSGSTTINETTGTWINSTSAISANLFTINYTIFSARPSCFCSVFNGGANCNVSGGGALTSTSAQLQMSQATGELAVVCIGPT